MSRERGQSTIEAVFAIPLCMLAAAGLVDVGVVVRDQMSLTAAAGRAGAAQLAGADVEGAARENVPASLRPTLQVQAVGGRVQLSARSRTLVLSKVTDTMLRADAITAVGGGAR